MTNRFARASLLSATLMLAATPVAASDLFHEDFAADGSPTLGTMRTHSAASNADWAADGYASERYAEINGYGADTASDDYLITPAIDLAEAERAYLHFRTKMNFGGGSLDVLATDAYSGGAVNPDQWQTLTDYDLSPGNYALTDSGAVELSDYLGGEVVVAFRYRSTGTGAGDGALWQVHDVRVTDDAPALEAEIATETTGGFDNALVGETVSLKAVARNAEGEVSYTWQLGDGTTATGAEVAHTYQLPGRFTATLTATDAAGESATASQAVPVDEARPEPIPEAAGELRVATFNVALYGDEPGAVLARLESGDDPQIRRIAEIIQRVRPDVILLNELDYEAGGAAVAALQNHYLGVGQNGAEAIRYDHRFVAPVNTGVVSGHDLNNDGSVGGPDDALGYGTFAGQYGMAVLSRLPIDRDGVRTFRDFLWKDMPDAMLPADPQDADGNGRTDSWYSPEELAALPLSSKSHWDVPVIVDGERVHLLASHPTPPVFDGEEDRNGHRNHDEIRFWADYVDAQAGDYIVDDAGVTGGLESDSRFVILGDLNADPNKGDGVEGAITQLLDNPAVNADIVPTSLGAQALNPGDPHAAADTLPGSGGLRLDYVLPSKAGLDAEQAGVFWPGPQDPLRRLAGGDTEASSDHRLVWLDVSLTGDGGEDSDDDDDGGGGAVSWFGGLLLLAAAALRRRRSYA
ncbi:endonuclease/exonuclease/phosphatase family protein [Arhodomonas sp. AD133]|uniref:endonuclease/exonuclease/phosphatase family protein n=1 Tax=Arhodomonas sp. AD133 TaxID=3415009 RepID=UPI003EBD04A0